MGLDCGIGHDLLLLLLLLLLFASKSSQSLIVSTTFVTVLRPCATGPSNIGMLLAAVRAKGRRDETVPVCVCWSVGMMDHKLDWMWEHPRQVGATQHSYENINL